MSLDTSATFKVLNLPELLEQLLLELDLYDLFKLTRVNKKFHDVIKLSKPIQQKMFLREGTAVNASTNLSTITNPSLLNRQIGLEGCEVRVEEKWHPKSGSAIMQVTFVRS